MYFYFYDKFTQDKQYESALIGIETTLIDLGINGRVEKLSIFKDARSLIEDGLKKGARTVIAVGDDKTFATVVNITAPYDVTVGFLPIVNNSKFATLLGMPSGEEACTVLSRRLTKIINLAKVGDQYFIGSATLPNNASLRIQCDDQYTVSPLSQSNTFRIMSLGDVLTETLPKLSRTADNRIELVVSPIIKSKGLFKKGSMPHSGESIFPSKHIDITSTTDPLSFTADDVVECITPCRIETAPKAMKIIVGRERLFQISPNN